MLLRFTFSYLIIIEADRQTNGKFNTPPSSLCGAGDIKGWKKDEKTCMNVKCISHFPDMSSICSWGSVLVCNSAFFRLAPP